NDFWERFIDEMGLDKTFALKRRKERSERQSAFEEKLSKHFSRVEAVILPGALRYDDSEALLVRMSMKYDKAVKYLNDNKEKIIGFFDKKIEKEGSIILDTESIFYHCYK
uniref:hypothetical protein n=1 Tax=Ruminococcus sp. TaxID=41978 RepID=UPI00344C51E1